VSRSFLAQTGIPFSLFGLLPTNCHQINNTAPAAAPPAFRIRLGNVKQNCSTVMLANLTETRLCLTASMHIVWCLLMKCTASRGCPAGKTDTQEQRANTANTGEPNSKVCDFKHLRRDLFALCVEQEVEQINFELCSTVVSKARSFTGCAGLTVSKAHP
jgi:hypothetical protein